MPSNVLVVGNESESLQNLPQQLSPYSSDFTILTAADRDEALEILRTSMIDLLVTDLQTPPKNGFQLLFDITTSHPLVPVLILNSYTEASCSEDSSSTTSGISLNLEELRKSLYLEELRESILEICQDPKKAGAIFGVCLSHFLQLIEKENGSCTLVVVTPSKDEGFFLFKDGVLAQAFLHNTRGKEAAQAMLAHKKVSIMIRELPERNIPNEIECSVSSILTEAAQHKDESTDSDTNDSKLDSEEPSGVANAHQEPGEVKENEGNIKQDKRVLDSILQELIAVNGVIAVGFIQFSGEMIAVKSNDDTSKPDLIISTYNEIFLQARAACRKINMETLDEVVIYTPKGIIIMHCLEADTVEHLHLIGILHPNGNKALFKLKTAKLLSHLKNSS